MPNSSMVLPLAILMLMLAPVGAAQQDQKPRDLADAPSPKQESTAQKHQNAFNTTFEVLGRRSIVFPEIATNPNALSVKQKFELFVDQSIAPFHFVASAAGSGIDQARDALPAYGQGMSGYGKRF